MSIGSGPLQTHKHKCKYCDKVITEAYHPSAARRHGMVYIVMGNNFPESAWLSETLAFRHIHALKAWSEKDDLHWHIKPVQLHDGNDFQFITLEVTL